MIERRVPRGIEAEPALRRELRHGVPSRVILRDQHRRRPDHVKCAAPFAQQLLPEDVRAAGEPTVGVFNHVALVWNAGNNSVEAFLNGVSQGVASTGNAFDVSSPNVGYGFFSRFLNRAVDGQLDAVAFSTFTGTFDPASDFQLTVVPEPASFLLLTIALGGLALVRKK